MSIWSAEIKELELLSKSIMGKFPDLEKELEQLLKFDDANVILIYSRRCLEVIINELCETELKRPRKTEPLKGIIDKLGHEEKVPSHIIASMEGLNSLSTFGAHPKDFDPEQLKPVLSNLAIIIKWYLKYKTEKKEAQAGEGYRGQGTGDKGEKVQGTGDRVQGAGVSGESVEGQEGGTAEMEAIPKGLKEAGPIFNSWKKPTAIISGVLVLVVTLYIVFDQLNLFRKDKFEDIRNTEGEISIAVMPFENLTGDTTLNWFQKGISSLIINGLGNSPELAVLDDQTMFEAMEGMNEVYTAGISPSVAKEVAKRVKAGTYISGSFQGREDTYWVLVNLVNTESGEIIWTSKVAGNLKSSGYLDLADSLCNEIKNHLEIKALESNADYEFREVYPKSAEAYRYFIEGMNLVLNQNLESGIQSLIKAVEIDSTFTIACFYLAYAYNSMPESPAEQNLWLKRAYLNKDRIPTKYQLWVDMWYACQVGKSIKDVSHYCDLLAESGINTRLFWSDIGVTYCGFSHEYEKAIPAFEKVMEINQERGSDWKFVQFYERFLIALHKTGNHKREKEIAEIGLKIFPNSNYITYYMAVCALSQGKTTEADEIIVKYKAKHKELGTPERNLEANLGQMYMEANIMDQAEKYYRKAYELSGSENNYYKFALANFLINNDINIDEGVELIGELLATWPDNLFLLKSKGRGLYKQGKYEEAVQLLKEVQEKWPGADYELSVYLPEAEHALANKKN